MSVPVIAFFNNKGGIGKTSMVYHLSWMFADRGMRVIAADLDPQCNLTAAFLDDDRLTTGNSAFVRARINPRRIQHRYWSSLDSAPLVDRRFGHLSAADLVSRQLEQMWAMASGSNRRLIVAVPS